MEAAGYRASLEQGRPGHHREVRKRLAGGHDVKRTPLSHLAAVLNIRGVYQRSIPPPPLSPEGPPSLQPPTLRSPNTPALSSCRSACSFWNTLPPDTCLACFLSFLTPFRPQVRCHLACPSARQPPAHSLRTAFCPWFLGSALSVTVHIQSMTQSFCLCLQLEYQARGFAWVSCNPSIKDSAWHTVAVRWRLVTWGQGGAGQLDLPLSSHSADPEDRPVAPPLQSHV